MNNTQENIQEERQEERQRKEGGEDGERKRDTKRKEQKLRFCIKYRGRDSGVRLITYTRTSFTDSIAMSQPLMEINEDEVP